MDFGDLQNHRTGKKAAEAARVARENSVKIQQIQDSISQQHNTAEREKNFAAGLYELSIELDEDLRILSYEPTEEASVRIAEKYLRNPIDEFLDHNNYPALEYKELANKTKEKYSQLTGDAWYKWGKDQILPLILQEAQDQAAAERKAAEEFAQEQQRKKIQTEIKLFRVFGIILMFFPVFWLFGSLAGRQFDSDSALCPFFAFLISIGLFYESYRRQFPS